MIIVKGICFVLIGALTPLGAALAQWANSGEWPNAVVWIVIIGGCVVGGATQLLSFLSSAYADYVQTQPGSTMPGPGPTAVAAASSAARGTPPIAAEPPKA